MVYEEFIRLGSEEALNDINYDIENNNMKKFINICKLEILSIFYDYGYVNTYKNIKEFYNEYFVTSIDELI